MPSHGVQPSHSNTCGHWKLAPGSSAFLKLQIFQGFSLRIGCQVSPVVQEIRHGAKVQWPSPQETRGSKMRKGAGAPSSTTVSSPTASAGNADLVR